MIENNLKHLEEQVIKSNSIPSDEKTSILELVTKLHTELKKLETENQEQAKSIAGFAQINAHEKLRAEKDESLIKSSDEGLTHAAQSLKTSHPDLVNLVDTLSRTLSRLGI